MSESNENSIEQKIAQKLEVYGPAAKAISEGFNDQSQSKWMRATYTLSSIAVFGAGLICFAAKEINLSAISLVFFPIFAFAAVAFRKAINDGTDKNTTESPDSNSRSGSTE